MKAPDFYNFLIDEHANQYVGTDDCMPDDFDRWLCELEPEDYIRMANVYACQYGKHLIKECQSIVAA